MVQTNATSSEDTPDSQPVVGALHVSVSWPVRAGSIPPLADRYTSRSESGPDLAQGLQHSPVVALTPRSSRVSAGASHDLLRCTGKTQLAAYYAESLWQARAVDLLVWVDASSRASILSGYVSAASLLAAAQPDGGADDTATSFLRWLAGTDRRWLMVLDDAPDAEVLRGLWPRGPGGRVVITTANSDAVANLQDLLVLELGPFSPREAMTYLVSRLSKDPDQRRGAIDLIQDLGCQPLALAQATAVIGSSWQNCVDYREQFYRRMTVFNAPGGGAVPAAAVTWTLSVDHAGQLAPGDSAQACLALAALLDGHGAPASVFDTEAARSYLAGGTASAERAPEPARAALTALEQSGLLIVDRQASPPLVRMHAALQRAIQLAMLPELLEQAGRAAAGALLEAWPASDRGVFAAYGLRSSVTSLVRATGGLLWSDGCHPVLLRAGQSLDDAGMPAAAVAYWRELGTASDRVLGAGHPDSLQLAERLAVACSAAGLQTEAIASRQRIADERVRALGPQHSLTLAAQSSLGRSLVAAGEYSTAIAVLAAALAESEPRRGQADPEVISIRDELAAAYLAAGRTADATRMLKSTLAERERRSGPGHRDTIAARQRLAEASLASGQLKDAIALYRRAIADSERVNGPDHRATLRARSALATAYQQSGKISNAVSMYELTRDGCTKALGPDDPDTLAICVSLAKMYYALGHLANASTLLRDTLERCEVALPPGDPITRSAEESLAAIGQ
ncbi:MAG: tetratricopeptide repeat protein [Streptosporangiaceae bacterium]